MPSGAIWSHLESCGTRLQGHSGTLGLNLSGMGDDWSDTQGFWA